MPNCDYCGEEYFAEARQCSGCGKSFGPEAEAAPPRKSKAVAVLLATIFGPLGLLYLGREGLMIVFFVVGMGIFLFPILTASAHMRGINLLITILARVACVTYALHALAQRNEGHEDENKAGALLDEAVKLESVDIEQAISKYEEVVRCYPKSFASKAATTCINTLKSNKH